MTLTIELPREIAANVTAQAEAQGLRLSQYVEHLLREQTAVPSGPALSPIEKAALWRESVLDLPHTPPLSEEAISCESIYGDHG
jgi:hypothetical protein